MPLVTLQPGKPAVAAGRSRSARTAAAALVSACVLAAFAAAPASAASLSQSLDVDATPAAVWSAIGPFCAIRNWLPPIGSCVEDGKSPPTRTLVTRDGAATFVETETARNDDRHFYSYTFKSSPLPVTRYNSTIEVAAKGERGSTVTWRSTYTPAPGQEQAANEALSGVYAAGLAFIKARFAE